MKPTTLIGMALIVLGVLALAYQGITYTTHEKVVEVGPLKATVEKEKKIPKAMAVTFLIVLSVLLLTVAIFALDNAQAVTVRFLYWQLQSSVAVVTLAATAAGALVAGLFGLASRLRRWTRGRAATGAARPPALPSEPRSPAGLSSRRGD